MDHNKTSTPISSPTHKTRIWCHYRIAPLLLILLCPFAALLMWNINTVYNGSIYSFYQAVNQHGLFHLIYAITSPVVLGNAVAWKCIGIFALVQLILMRIIPGKPFKGPTTPNGHTPVYKANGFYCYLITLTLFLVCSEGLHWFSATIIYDNFAAIIGALNIFSLAFCLLLYFKGRFAPSGKDAGLSGYFIFDFYWGTELYPRLWGWDLKMFTNCRFGMMAWPLIIISFAAKQTALTGLSNSMIVAMSIMMTYLTKFFIWETGYLRSMDIMQDRAGFYICWGCLVWVPAIYTSPILYLVNHPINLSFITAVIIAIIGLGGVMINFLADRQRQLARATKGQCLIWGKPPTLIHAAFTDSSGKQRTSILLASGWWGIARHFHYLPEIIAAFCWTVPALFSHALPYFYVCFLTVLLIHRALRDELKCRIKYGVHWTNYVKAVPSLIIPGVRWRSKQVLNASCYEVTGPKDCG